MRKQKTSTKILRIIGTLLRIQYFIFSQHRVGYNLKDKICYYKEYFEICLIILYLVKKFVVYKMLLSLSTFVFYRPIPITAVFRMSGLNKSSTL